VFGDVGAATGLSQKSFSPDCRENCQPQSTSTRGRSPASARRQILRAQGNGKMSIIWTIIIGFLAGVVAKFIMPETMSRQGSL